MSKGYSISQGTCTLTNEKEANLSQFQNQLQTIGDAKEFPVRTLRTLGTVQIGIAAVLGVLSIVGIILDLVAMQSDCGQNYYDDGIPRYSSYWLCSRREDYTRKLFVFDVTCFVLSGWYVLTGCLPLCMPKRDSTWRGMRVGYMVCSIIGASVFAPTMFSLGVVGVVEREDYDANVVVLSVLMVALSVAEFVLSVIGASYSCRHTRWENTDHSIDVVDNSQPGMLVNIPSAQMQMTVEQPNLYYAVGQSGYPIIVQYPGTQQHQVITSNTPWMNSIFGYKSNDNK